MQDIYSSTIQQDAVIFDKVGHQYRVINGGPFRYFVQPLTPCGTSLVAVGKPVWMFRSDIRF